MVVLLVKLIKDNVSPAAAALASAGVAFLFSIGSVTQDGAMSAGLAQQHERKRVTVLFADISDSTSLVEKMDPEQVVSDLLPTVDEMSQVVRRFGGTVLRPMGDGIMAVFGAPIALERHAERACHAALEILRQVEERHNHHGTSSRPNLRLHLGVATGEVVVGMLNDDSTASYDAAGFTVHLASRLQSMAPPGCIYINHAAYKWVKDQFECIQLGQARVRGSSDPVQIYRLMAQRREAASRSAAGDGRTPFVGRDLELARLVGFVQRLEEGSGSIVSITGDAGVGKSRLIRELRHRVASLPYSWHEGAALSYGQTLPYWPFLALLRDFSGIGERDDEETVWRKLDGKVREVLGADAPSVLPYIATLLGLHVSGPLDERVKYLDGLAIRRQVFRSMRMLLERAARRRPMVIVLEDAFWMDRASADLLAHLVPLVRSTPLLFCLVTRNEADGSDIGIRRYAVSHLSQYYAEVALKPLPPDDTLRLVRHLLRTSNLPHRLHQVICATSEGNPLFAEELSQSFLDDGSDLRVNAPTQTRQAAAVPFPVSLPGSIESVIMARVDRLEESAKELLKTASVIGRTFFIRILAAMVGSPQVTQDGLIVLRDADLIIDGRKTPEPECAFKHVLVQEATYNSILLKRRRELHARAGAAIEQLFPDRLDELAGLLAYHFARAEQWENAQHYLLQAGDRADRLAADEEALAHFQSASDTYMRAFGRAAEPLWQASIARKIGEAYYRKGDSISATEKFREALTLLGSWDPRSRLALYAQLTHQTGVQALHRLLPVGLFDRRLGRSTPADEERIRIYIKLWWLNFFESPLRTLLYSLKTLNESERSGETEGVVHSCSTLGFMCCVLGAAGVGSRYHVRAMEQARESNNLVMFGHAELGLGWHRCYTGRWAAALDHFQRSTEASQRAGDLRQWGSATWGLVVVLCTMGRLGEAWAHAAELFKVSEASGDQINLRWSHVAQGMVHLRAGAFDQGSRHLQTAMRSGQEASDWQIYTKCLSELVRAHLRAQDTGPATEWLNEATETVRKYGLRGHHETEYRNQRARLLLALAERASGRAARQTLVWQARWACRRAIRGGTVYQGSLPEALRLRGYCAWLADDRRGALKWWQRSQHLCERVGADYDLALTHLCVGRRLENADHLAQAHALLEQMKEGVPTS